MYGQTALNQEVTLWGGRGFDDVYRFYSLDFNYLRTILPNLFFETGLEISNHTFYKKTIYSAGKTVNLITIPMACRLRFFNYLFVNAGPLIDIDNSLSTSIDRQSGVGAFVGGGIYFEYHRLTLSVSIQKQWHSLISYKSQENHKPLVDYGLNCGFGYKF